MITRRDFVRVGGMSLAVACSRNYGQAADSLTTVEKQKGDPDVPYEYVSFDGEAIHHMVTSSGKATFERWDQDLPLKMITSAAGFVGASRETTPERITDFLALFKLPFKDEKGYVAFCAAGVSYCALMAYTDGISVPTESNRLKTFRNYMPDVEHYYFFPTVSCVSMYHLAAAKGRWIDHKDKPGTVPKPGWIVLYDWSKSGTPDHCGIVTEASAKGLSTIEFNTSGKAGGSQRNGGTVAEKDRNYEYVRGFIVTNAKPE